MNKPFYDVTALKDAGFGAEDIELCNQRFEESRFTNYADWCRAYIALNSTRKADDGGIQLNGEVIIKALLANNAKSLKKKAIFKVSKNKCRP